MKINRGSQTGTEKKLRRMNFRRRILSILFLFICAVPMFGGGVQAIWVIPAAVCICMYEEEYFSMLIGVLGGWLIDFACGSIFCANAIYLVCFCTFLSLLFRNLLRRTFLNFLAVTMIGTFLRAILSYLMTQVLFQNEGRSYIWSQIHLPSSVLTIFAAILVYLLYLPIARFLTRRVKSMDAAAIHRET